MRVSEWLLDFFASSAVALVTMIVLLVATSAIYIWTHRHPITQAQRLEQLKSAIVISKDGLCGVAYDDAMLARWFGVGEINLLKARLKDKAAEAAHQNALERRQLLGPIRALAQRGLSDTGPLQVLPTTGAEADDAIWDSVLLDETNWWLTAKIGSFVAEKQAEARRFLEVIERQIRREQDRAEVLRGEVGGMDSALSFAWLKVEDSHWIFEVIVWTMFGVISSTTIALIDSARKGTYKADEFVLVLPKLFLAPLLSVVAIAVWSSGFTTAPVSFLNLPLFLVLSFSLGLVTEQLYVALRKGAQAIVARFVSIDEDKFAAAAQNLPYAFLHPQPAPAAGDATPANLKDLADALQAQAKAAVERGLVAKLANTNPAPPSP